MDASIRPSRGQKTAPGYARAFICLLAGAITACASDLDRSPVTFTALAPGVDADSAPLRMPAAVTLTPSTGYSETVHAGSAWQRVGATPQGDVFRPVGGVFSVEGANHHEAYLVIARGRIVGFYLPGERAFAPLPQPVPLPVR
jgi:hypothetical protein